MVSRAGEGLGARAGAQDKARYDIQQKKETKHLYKIVHKRRLNDEVTLMRVEAPYVARHALPGQFVMLRVDENGERIPLTIADYDQASTVTVISKVGATTRLMDELEEGRCLQDFAGRWAGRPKPGATSARPSSAAVWAWRSPIRKPGRCTRGAPGST